MRHAIECDAATDHVRVAAHALLPEILSDHGHIGGVFFFWQKIAAANWFHPENIEIIRGHFTAEKLNRIAETGQSERNVVFAGESVKNRLAITIMLKPRDRHSELQQFALPGIRIHVQHTCRFFEGQTAQKKIVNQTEDRGIQSNAESEREQGEE